MSGASGTLSPVQPTSSLEDSMRNAGFGLSKGDKIYDAAKKVSAAGSVANALATMKLLGVGDKTKNCVELFSLDRPRAFPVDTHIEGTLKRIYCAPHHGLSRTRKAMRKWAQRHFGDHAGYASQFLFLS